MPDVKFSQLNQLYVAAADDYMPIVDNSDNSMGITGTNKKISVDDLTNSLVTNSAVNAAIGDNLVATKSLFDTYYAQYSRIAYQPQNVDTPNLTITGTDVPNADGTYVPNGFEPDGSKRWIITGGADAQPTVIWNNNELRWFIIMPTLPGFASWQSNITTYAETPSPSLVTTWTPGLAVGPVALEATGAPVVTGGLEKTTGQFAQFEDNIFQNLGNNTDPNWEIVTGTTRVLSVTDSDSPVINTDLYDAVNITATVDIASMSEYFTGTPSNFDMFMFRIKDDGTARSITWGAQFEPKGADLPTTTVPSKVLHALFIWDSFTSKWGCLSTAQEA